MEIVDQVPSAMLNIDKVECTRSMYRDKQFSETWHDLEATYIFGHTGAGKLAQSWIHTATATVTG